LRSQHGSWGPHSPLPESCVSFHINPPPHVAPPPTQTYTHSLYSSCLDTPSCAREADSPSAHTHTCPPPPPPPPPPSSPTHQLPGHLLVCGVRQVQHPVAARVCRVEQAGGTHTLKQAGLLYALHSAASCNDSRTPGVDIWHHGLPVHLMQLAITTLLTVVPVISARLLYALHRAASRQPLSACLVFSEMSIVMPSR